MIEVNRMKNKKYDAVGSEEYKSELIRSEVDQMKNELAIEASIDRKKKNGEGSQHGS
jgi:hypothetical protein